MPFLFATKVTPLLLLVFVALLLALALALAVAYTVRQRGDAFSERRLQDGPREAAMMIDDDDDDDNIALYHS